MRDCQSMPAVPFRNHFCAAFRDLGLAGDHTRPLAACGMHFLLDRGRGEDIDWLGNIDAELPPDLAPQRSRRGELAADDRDQSRRAVVAMVVQEVLPRDSGGRLSRRERERTYAREVITDIGRCEPGAREQMCEVLE